MTTKGNDEKKVANRRENLEDQIHDTLIKMGWIVPQTENDVTLAKSALVSTECPPLPDGLADPFRIIDRLAEGEEEAERKASIRSPALPLSALIKRLEQAGVSSKLLWRVCPRDTTAEARRFITEAIGNERVLVTKVAKIISRVFGWSLDIILNPAAPLRLSPATINTAQFKLPARASSQWLVAYTVYAHTLVIILLEATKNLPRQPIPTSSEDLRNAIKAQFGSVTFEHALQYAWSLGVPVLPLNDSGAFHGACWRVDGRNAIVLKQRVRSLARWLYDLIHELCHAGRNPLQPDLSLVECESLEARRLSPEEEEANRFAGDVVLDGRAEQLAQMCVAVAEGKIQWLKRAVPTVATSEHVAADALANYLAFRLSLQGENWWGTATALQNTDIDPWHVARRVLQEQVEFSSLSSLDRALLEHALTDERDVSV